MWLFVCWEDWGISKSDLCRLGPQPLMFIRKSQQPENQIGRIDPNKMRFSFRFTSTFHKPNGGQLTKIRWNSFCVLRVLSTTLKWGTSDQIRWNYFIFVFFCTLHYTRRESKCNLAMYIGKYHKNPKPTNGILLLWSHVIRLCKKSFGYLSLATRWVTNVDCVKQNCANYISCTDYICSRWGIWNLWLRVWPSLRLSQQHCFIITLTKSGVSRCFQT